MRADTNSLLLRLGQKDFRYREFHDAFADMELWPIFEALLADERVVGKRLSPLAEKEAALRAAERGAQPAPAPRRAEPGGDIFARYVRPADSAQPSPAEGLRAFLTGLSGKSGG